MKRKKTDWNWAEVERLAGNGFSEADICLALDVSPAALALRRREHLRQSVQRGRIRTADRVADSLYRAAMNGNITACIFWLKTQAGWREPQPVPTGDHEEEWSRERLISEFIRAARRAGNNPPKALGPGHPTVERL